MKKKLFIIAILFMLTACAPATENKPIVLPAAPIAASSSTPSLSPMPSKELSPIPVTPTEAVDTETGWKITRTLPDGTPVLFSPDVNIEVVRGGGAWLIDHDELGAFPNTFQMEIYHQADSIGPKVSQPSDVSAYPNFTTYFTPKVAQRLLGYMPNTATGLADEINKGKVDISFTTPQGPQSFKITGKYRVYIMPYDQMPDGSVKWNKAGDKWYVKGDGTNAIAVIAYKQGWEAQTKETFMENIMDPLAAIMTPKQSIGLYTPTIQAYPAGYLDYTNAASLKDFQVEGLK